MLDSDTYNRIFRLVLMFIIAILTIIYAFDIDYITALKPTLVITSGFMLFDTYFPRIHYSE